MKVFVTRWAISGRVDFVDLAPNDTGKYWCGNDNDIHYFMSKKDICLTKEDAKMDIAERFNRRRERLKRQLLDLDKVEMSALYFVESTPTPVLVKDR